MGDEVSSNFRIRQILANDPDYIPALELIFGGEAPSIGSPKPTGGPSATIADVLTQCARSRRPLELLFGAYKGDRLISAAAAIETSGSAALVVIPERSGPQERPCIRELLVKIHEAAQSKSLDLLELLVEPSSPPKPLEDAGFRFLTQLVYLIRPPAPIPKIDGPPSDLKWLNFSSQTEGLFLTALERSYAQTLDCPELTNVRSTQDVLAGYQGIGVHDPSFWWVVLQENEPVGVSLLGSIAGSRLVEVVYLGVAQPSRGTGVANALLARAVRRTGAESDIILTLAVDCRNRPARRLYERWGFKETLRRDAWIATSGGI